MPVRQWLLMITAILLSGCASNVPDAIRDAPPEELQVTEARRSPETLNGKPARWGGNIVSVRNLKEETHIEVVSRELDRDGRPRDEDISQGRFLAKVAGFLDPAVYETGREVTVRGQIDGVVKISIGEFPYTYPVLRAEHVHLWEKRPPPQPYTGYDPFYDPFWYDPWYPWRPWGYPYWPHYRYR